MRVNVVSAVLALGALVVAALTGHLIARGDEDLVLYGAAGVVWLVMVMRPEYGLYIMAFLVPLHAFLLFDDSVTINRVVGTVVGLAWGLNKLLTQGDLSFLTRTRLTPALLAWFILGAASLFWNLDESRWETSMLTLVQLLIFFFIFVDVVGFSEQVFRRMVFIWWVGSIVSAVLLLVEFVTIINLPYLERATGAFLNPNMAASAQLIALPIGLYMLINAQHPVPLRLAGLISAIIFIVAIGTTVSRTNLILVPLILGLFALRNFKNSTNLATSVIAGLILLLTVTMPADPEDAFLGRIVTSVANRFNPESNVFELGGRTDRWEGALLGLSQSPITGFGYGNKWLPGYGNVIAHNFFLQLGFEMGIPGILIGVWVWIRVFQMHATAARYARESGNSEITALMSALSISVTAYFVFCFFANNHDDRPFWLLLAFTEAGYQVTVRPQTLGMLRLRAVPGQPLPSAAQSGNISQPTLN